MSDSDSTHALSVPILCPAMRLYPSTWVSLALFPSLLSISSAGPVSPAPSPHPKLSPSQPPRPSSTSCQLRRCLRSRGSFLTGALQLVPCAAAAAVFSDGSSACVSLCSCLLMASYRPDEDPSPCLGPQGSAGVALSPALVGFCASAHPPPPGPLPGPTFLPLAHPPPLFTLRLSLPSLSKPCSLHGPDARHDVTVSHSLQL